MCYNNEAMKYAWHSKLKGSKKLLLLALADHVDEQGSCYPGVSKLAEKCSIKTNSGVRRVMNQLVECGELLIQINAGIKTTSGATNRYWLVGFRKAMGLSELTFDSEDGVKKPSDEFQGGSNSNPDGDKGGSKPNPLESEGSSSSNPLNAHEGSKPNPLEEENKTEGGSDSNPLNEQGGSNSNPHGGSNSNPKHTGEPTDQKIKDISPNGDKQAPPVNAPAISENSAGRSNLEHPSPNVPECHLNEYEQRLRATIWARTKPSQRGNIDFENPHARKLATNYEALFAGRSKKGVWAENKIDDPPMDAAEIIAFGVICGSNWKADCESWGKEQSWTMFMPKKAESVAEKVLEFRADPRHAQAIRAAKNRYWTQVMGEPQKLEPEEPEEIADFAPIEQAMADLVQKFEEAG